MRRLTAIFLIVFVLLGAAACSVQDLDIDMGDLTDSASQTDLATAAPAETAAGDTADPTPQAASASDAEETDSSATDTAAPEVTASPTQAPAQTQTDYSSLTAEQCIEDAWPEAGVLPRITVDCDGADTINAAITDAFSTLADDPMCTVYYQYFKNENILSILMVVDYQTDYMTYTPYNLDLATGQALEADDLISLLETTQANLAALELSLMGIEFEFQYGGLRSSDQTFYQQQYDKTVAEENADTERLWIGGDGQLYFVGRIYAMAGAESYEYPMGTGLFFVEY